MATGARQTKVIILMATYNGSRFISEQLTSLIAQSHTNWELIVSDDGSTDETLSIVRSFAQTVEQRVVVIAGPRQGFWRNFLSLVRYASASGGDLFAYCDQDDIWLADKLARAVEWFGSIKSDSPALYFARTELIDDLGRSVGRSPLFCRRPTFQNALVQNIGGGNTMVMNRTAIVLLSKASTNLELIAHDWWTYQLITGADGCAYYDPRPSTKYRQHARNLIGSNRGIGPRMARTTAFVSGRWKQWNDVSIAALEASRHLLSSSSSATLDKFSSARRNGPWKRLRLLFQSGVYRQNRPETIAMYIGALFDRI